MALIKQKVLFSPDECSLILKSTGEWNRSEVYNEDNEIIISAIRTSQEKHPTNEDLPTDLLLDKLGIFGVTKIPMVKKIVRYETSQYYNTHVDKNVKLEINLERHRTILIQLTDPSEYEGGEVFLHQYVGVPKVPFDKTIGNVVMFNSEIPHHIETITSGVRYVFVCWLEEGNYV